MTPTEAYQAWTQGKLYRRTVGKYVRYFNLDGALVKVIKNKHAI